MGKHKRVKLCPVCGDRISIRGRTVDGRAIGSCGDAFPPRSRVEREEAGIMIREVARGGGCLVPPGRQNDG